MAEVREYMQTHPESELHRRGKMFGVLVVRNNDNDNDDENLYYLKAFSAMLDGTYHHEGFVPPVYECRMDSEDCIGHSREESQLKQQAIFRRFRFLNVRGEEKDLITLFEDVPPILSVEDYFSQNRTAGTAPKKNLPPSGAGECCAPKLLQAAFLQGLVPVCIAEFWMGASPKDELRVEGHYYPACSGKCRPILRHVLEGMEIDESEDENRDYRLLATQTEVLYEDEYLIAVNKPSGLLSVPGKDGQYSLLEYLTSNSDSGLTSNSDCGLRSVFPVHRLDQDTSGVIVFAKTQEVATALQQLFLRRDIHKVYEAELEPVQRMSCMMMEQDGTIELPLLANPLDRPRQMVNHQHGKVAITHYHMTGATGPHGGAMVELRPETGRTHQLRVHCAHIEGLGVPIYGDRLYGSLPLSTSASTSRLMLHAREIAFPHPITGQMLTIRARSMV